MSRGSPNTSEVSFAVVEHRRKTVELATDRTVVGMDFDTKWLEVVADALELVDWLFAVVDMLAVVVDTVAVAEFVAVESKRGEVVVAVVEQFVVELELEVQLLRFAAAVAAAAAVHNFRQRQSQQRPLLHLQPVVGQFLFLLLVEAYLCRWLAAHVESEG